VAEAVVFHIMKYLFPESLFSVRVASRFDDLIKKADVVIDRRGLSQPLVSAIDVTTAKDDIFLGKLVAAKKYYSSLFNLGREEANKLISLVKTNKIKDLPEGSQELHDINDCLSLKYYTCPDFSGQKGKPMPMLIAPRLVISIPCQSLFDNFFSSKISVAEKAAQEIGYLVLVQTSAFIEALIRYCSFVKTEAVSILEAVRKELMLWRQILNTDLKEEIALATQKIIGDSFLKNIVCNYTRDVIGSLNLIKV
jgi:hypothetical protein